MAVKLKSIDELDGESLEFLDRIEKHAAKMDEEERDEFRYLLLAVSVKDIEAWKEGGNRLRTVVAGNIPTRSAEYLLRDALVISKTQEFKDGTASLHQLGGFKKGTTVH